MSRGRSATLGTSLAVGVVVAAVVASAGRMLADDAAEIADVQGSIHPLLKSVLAVAWLIPSIVLVRRRGGLPFGWLGLVASGAHGLAAMSRKWIDTLVSSEETASQVKVIFEHALELEGLWELLTDERLDLAADDPTRPILLAVSDNGP